MCGQWAVCGYNCEVYLGYFLLISGFPPSPTLPQQFTWDTVNHPSVPSFFYRQLLTPLPLQPSPLPPSIHLSIYCMPLSQSLLSFPIDLSIYVLYASQPVSSFLSYLSVYLLYASQPAFSFLSCSLSLFYCTSVSTVKYSTVWSQFFQASFFIIYNEKFPFVTLVNQYKRGTVKGIVSLDWGGLKMILLDRLEVFNISASCF